MDNLSHAAEEISALLQTFITKGQFKLSFRIEPRLPGQDTSSAGPSAPGPAPSPANLLVEFTGPDTPVLTARNGELLNALEHIAVKALRLESEEHDRIVFDADQFKANRDRELRQSAFAAVDAVRATARPHAFPPMTSRERRMLHLVLKDFGLPTASSGEAPARFVVLYPEGAVPEEPSLRQPAVQHDAIRLRHAFRHR